ncbi:MAG: helix-turn-helix domain-containing protein [Bacteroidota bacterium]
MPAEVLTKEDLELFRIQLIQDIKNIVSGVIKPVTEKPEGYKTADVRKMLGCSVNKLVSLRISRKLRTKKIGGTVYYNKDDIKQLLEEGY